MNSLDHLLDKIVPQNDDMNAAVYLTVFVFS